MNDSRHEFDMIVIGGGIGGLATALGAVKKGLRVCVLEASARWGGRGASDFVGAVKDDAFTFNQGPHAIYPASWAMLRSLEVKPSACGLSPGRSRRFSLRTG